MNPQIQYCAKTITGSDRKKYHDFFLSGKDIWNASNGYLFVLCKGNNTSSSQFVCEAIISTFYANSANDRETALKNSIKKANLDLYNSTESIRAELACALIWQNRLFVYFLGHCRASYMSGNQISHDLGYVSLIEKLFEEGHLTLEETKLTPYSPPQRRISLSTLVIRS